MLLFCTDSVDGLLGGISNLFYESMGAYFIGSYYSFLLNCRLLHVLSLFDAAIFVSLFPFQYYVNTFDTLHVTH